MNLYNYLTILQVAIITAFSIVLVLFFIFIIVLTIKMIIKGEK